MLRLTVASDLGRKLIFCKTIPYSVLKVLCFILYFKIRETEKGFNHYTENILPESLHTWKTET